MPSPFPGMDPWLEGPGVFPDIHDAFIFLLREALNAVLPKGFFARGANRIWMDEERPRVPDVSITRPNAWETGVEAEQAAEPFTRVGMLEVETAILAEPVIERYLEIRSTVGERLVTAIEVLSPTNKSPGHTGRGSYRQKQSEFRTGRVNLVEIDLLRGGTHTTAIPLAELRQRAGAFDYHVCVTAVGVERRFFVAPFRLADRMPTIAIPLEGDAGPVSIGLQPIFDRAYDTGRYAESDYLHRTPEPPLSIPQRAWAESMLREKGLLK
jgi:Protein of unknown function (DUF4058)